MGDMTHKFQKTRHVMFLIELKHGTTGMEL